MIWWVAATTTIDMDRGVATCMRNGELTAGAWRRGGVLEVLGFLVCRDIDEHGGVGSR